MTVFRKAGTFEVKGNDGQRPLDYSPACIWTQNKHRRHGRARVTVPLVGGMPLKCLRYSEDEQEPVLESYYRVAELVHGPEHANVF